MDRDIISTSAAGGKVGEWGVMKQTEIALRAGRKIGKGRRGRRDGGEGGLKRQRCVIGGAGGGGRLTNCSHFLAHCYSCPSSTFLLAPLN